MLVLSIFLLLLKLHYSISTTTSNHTLFGFNCTETTNNNTVTNNYRFLISDLLTTFVSKASTAGFNYSSLVRENDQVSGLYMCRGDINGELCSDCIQEAKDKIIKSCSNVKNGLIWYDHCMLRYSEKSFAGKVDEIPKVAILDTRNITSNQTLFAETMVSTMNNLAVQVANDLSYFGTQVAKVSDSVSLYVLQQCTPDSTETDCYSCLKTIIAPIEAWHVELCLGIHIMLPSCNLQYEVHPFFNSLSSQLLVNSSSSNHSRSFAKKKLVYTLLPGCLAIAIVLVFGAWISTRKKTPLGNTDCEIGSSEGLQFDLNQIKAATRNFSIDNKLGEGGFGVVYKGKLDDGQEIAIKRLSKNSGQGIQEFKTEVVLLAELRHKNLVKLIGFCVTPNEKILVYEYLPNSSLDHLLSNPSKKRSLDWDVRFKIIVGIARGLMYLHEESQLKIIHRDLKSSNILLDGAMNPKIADFGLAKLFGVDQTQGDTDRIMGTYGYMAPEYAMTGHFSNKSDVYSFGIIILEILSGQRNSFFGRQQEEESLMHRAWRLWSEGNAFDLIDVERGENYPRKEVRKCFQLGLMCTQESAIDRPRIKTVVAALDSVSVCLPTPKAPTWLDIIPPTTTEKLVRYDQIAINEIEYHQVALDKLHPTLYSGEQDITNLYPR